MTFRLKVALPIAVSCAAASLSAHAVVITFEGIAGGVVAPNGVIDYASPVVLSGFTFTTPGTAPRFGTWTVASNANTTFSNYTGSTALFSETGAGSTMTASTSSPFTVASVQVANVYRGTAAGAVVTFSGSLAAGGSVTQNYTLPGDDVLHTVNLAGFAALSSFMLSSGVGSNAYQFDNVNVTAVPEPAAALLWGAGLLAVTALRRKA